MTPYTPEELGRYILDMVSKLSELGIDNVPAARKLIFTLWMRVWDSLYSPKQILHNLVVVATIQVVVVSLRTLSTLHHNFLMYATQKGRTEKFLLDKLARASNFGEWQAVANELDGLRGLDSWKHSDNSSLCDSSRLVKRIASTVEMLTNRDIFNLMFRLRGGLARDQFGVQHPGLFSRALGGTKRIVERYHQATASALNFICDTKDAEVPTDAKLAFFNETRHAYGRTALLLSGGGYLGYYHMGVVKALWTQVMLPRVISGSSAGSIMTAIVGTRTDEQLSELVLMDSVPADMRMDFLNHSTELRHPRAVYLQSLVPRALRWYSSVLLCFLFDDKIFNLDTQRFVAALQQDIGHETFQEAFDRTGRIINITVAPLNNYDPPRLLNYITAPHVCVWSAAAASSAIPGMFDSVSLIVKEPDGQFRPENEWTRQGLVGLDAAKAAKMAQYSDGSVESDLPMQQLSELFNVNHFIVSQVNPHSAMLTSMALQASIWSNAFYRALVGYARFLKNQSRDWLKNILSLFIFRSNSPMWGYRRGLVQTLTQEYEGRDSDVTIMPWTGHISPYTALLSTIKNPTEAEYLELLSVAEKNTWPYIPRIRAHCLVEKTLDKCVQRLRRRITEESDEDLRAMARPTGQQHSEVDQRPVLRFRDRTPSFYTSRSIVNLSGLSVADPTPLRKGKASSGAIASAVDAVRRRSHESNDSQVRTDAPHRASLADVWSLGRSSDECDQADLLAGHAAAEEDSDSSPGTPQQQQQADSSDQTEGSEGFWNTDVRATNMPLNLTEGPSHPVSMGGLRAASDSRLLLQSTDDLIGRMSSLESLRSHGEQRPPLQRRPSMANFYYKNAGGSASTADLLRSDSDEDGREGTHF